VRGAWGPTHLYLAFEIFDDDLQPGTFGGDSVELYFDLDLDSDFGQGAYTEDDFNFKIAPVLTSTETTLHVAQGKNGGKVVIPDDGNIKAAWVKTPGGYMIEAAIPWKTLIGDRKPELGMKFGFDTMIIDKDKNKKPAPIRVMFWSSSKVPFYDPRTFGRAELTE